MEENTNSRNNSALDFDLDEIRASVDKAKNETKEALDRLDFNLTPSVPEEKPSAEALEMTPSVSEEKSQAEPLDMKADDAEDRSESLARDFKSLDSSSGIEKASSDFDNAQDEAAGIAKPESKSPEIRTVSLREASSGSYASERRQAPQSASGSYAAEGGAVQGSRSVQSVAPANRKKEKKYVTRGALIACMIATMILSTLLGSILGSSGIFSDDHEDDRAERNDEALSQLNLSDSTGSELTVAQIVDKNEDAVVEIVVSGTSRGMWGQMQLTEGAGSGVIVRDDGYIVTNYHVIQGANKVQVTLHNGDAYPARIVGSDPSNDVAVIKIEETGLTTAEIGDSSKVAVGDLAVAIGNPLGQLGGTATTGIISALDRTLSVEGTTLTLLQTDAAINGGNSGGGLFNSRGELIGIVESKASAVGVEGLAFALPINSVAEIINDIIESGGNVSGQIAGTPAVGIVISDVSEEVSEYYGLEEPGVYIAQVTGNNAMRAGFQEQDRIVSFNGTKINNSSEFITLVRKCKIGDMVTIVVSRQGQEIEIKTELEELQTNQ